MREVQLAHTDIGAAALRSAVEADREAAWRALYEQHFDRVYRLIARFGVPSADIEDVTQSAFVVAYRRIREVDEVRNVPAWLRGIAVRVASEHQRWRKVRTVKRWLLESTWRAAFRSPPTPEAEASASEDADRIGQVLAKMSPKLRAVLVLVDIEECSGEQVASILGINRNTVRSRKRLAREQFRKLWRRRFGGQEQP